MVFISWCISIQEPSGNHTPPQLSPSLSQSTYTTGGSLDVPHIIMQGDARRRRNENYFDDIPRSKLERQMAQVRCSKPLWCFCLSPVSSHAFQFWSCLWWVCVVHNRTEMWPCYAVARIPCSVGLDRNRAFWEWNGPTDPCCLCLSLLKKLCLISLHPERFCPKRNNIV